MYKGTIFILKIYIMKEIVSNFNIKIVNLFKEPHHYILAWVCEIDNLQDKQL